MVAKKETGAVAHVSLASTRRRVTQARLALQRELRVVKDLAFLKAHTKLTPRQENVIDDAVRKASDVVTIYAEQYIRAATELIASNTK